MSDVSILFLTNKSIKYIVTPGRKLFFPLLCCKSILTPYDKWHLWQVSLLLVLELFARNTFKHICTSMLKYTCELNHFLSAEGWFGFVCCYASCGILNFFKGREQGSGFTKAVADCCLTWQFFSKQVTIFKGRLNNTGIQPSYVPNCIFLFQ